MNIACRVTIAEVITEVPWHHASGTSITLSMQVHAMCTVETELKSTIRVHDPHLVVVVMVVHPSPVRRPIGIARVRDPYIPCMTEAT